MKRYLMMGLAFLVTATAIAYAQVPGVNSTLNTVFTIVYEPATSKNTYIASTNFASPSAPTDVCILNGSATKTVRVRKITVYGTAGTLAVEPAYIIKRSTADSGGTSVIVTAVPLDSSFSAATAVAEVFTAVPTLGTAVGEIMIKPITFALTTSVLQPTTEFVFGDGGAAVILRGIAQQISLNLATVTGNGGTLYCSITWTEE